MIRPPLLREGDTVSIVSPASPIPALRPNRFERGIRNLAAMGFEVRAGERARAVSGHHTAGTAEQRVSDLHAILFEGSFAWLRQVSAVETLRKVWVQNFFYD